MGQKLIRAAITPLNYDPDPVTDAAIECLQFAVEKMEGCISSRDLTNSNTSAKNAPAMAITFWMRIAGFVIREHSCSSGASRNSARKMHCAMSLPTPELCLCAFRHARLPHSPNWIHV